MARTIQPDPGSDSSKSLALEARAVEKAFGGVKALDAMSLSVAAGRITGLIGPNGAGKSSLFDVLSGVQRPDAGAVRFLGRDVTDWPPHRRAQYGLVRTFQLSRELGRLSVLENLMVSPQAQLGERLWPNFLTPRAVRRADQGVYLRAVEVMDFVGLRALADDYAGELSGGQKKLLELGRALMTDCSVVLLDEPGAGVNRTLMNHLVEVIRTMNRESGTTFLIVEHDMELIARTCHSVSVMAAGHQLTDGTFDEVRRDPRVVEAYLGTTAA